MIKIVGVKQLIVILSLFLPLLLLSESPKKEKLFSDKNGEEVIALGVEQIDRLYQQALDKRESDRKAALKFAMDGGKMAADAGIFKKAFNCYYLAGLINQDKRSMFQPRAAIDAFELAAKYAEISGSKQNLMAAYKRLAEEYAVLKQSQMALDFYKKYTDLEEDKIQLKAQKLTQTLQETQKNMADQEVQISTLEDQKSEAHAQLEAVSKEMLLADNEIIRQQYENESIKLELSNERNRRNILLGGVVGFGLVLAFLSFAFIQNKKSKYRLQAKNILIEEERSKSDELLLNILPKPIATELKENGKTVPRQYENVTVLFTDFKSFTQISETLSPIELVNEIDYCFRAFDLIISRYNIEKIKTIGDAYLCVSGLPVPTENHCNEILQAALEIKDFMNNLVIQRQKDNKPSFTMRMGIHTGPLVAGVVGSTKFVYDVWGDTVNVAARMEQTCEEGKINVSAAVYDLAKSLFQFTYRGKVDAKNKGAMDMYYLEGKLPQAKQTMDNAVIVSSTS